MPWESNDDLPESVKVLPDEARTIFRKAANAAIGQGKPEDVAMKIGWAAVENAGWKKDEDGTWVKDKTYEMDMEIFAAGVWNGDRYTEQDLQDIVKNFYELRDTVKPFLKLGGVDPHQDVVHQPAIGWIDRLRIDNGRIIATVKDIPRIVFEAIKRKLYRRVSSELYLGFKAPDGKVRNLVLRAVALLGASLPAVSTLRDLTAYLQERDSAEKILVYDFISDDEKIIVAGGDGMSDNVIKTYEEKLAAESAARKAAEERAADAEARLKKYEEDRVKAIRDSSLAEVRAFCEQAVKDGKMPPFVRDAIFPKEGAAVVSFSEDHAIMLPFAVFKEFIDKARVIDFSERGVVDGKPQDMAGKSPGEIVDARARSLLAEQKVKTYSEAVQIVLREDKDLATEYNLLVREG